MVKATNEWAVPVLRYFFGSVRWYKTDLVRIDRGISEPTFIVVP